MHLFVASNSMVSKMRECVPVSNTLLSTPFCKNVTGCMYVGTNVEGGT